jgi:hypothetical protein
MNQKQVIRSAKMRGIPRTKGGQLGRMLMVLSNLNTPYTILYERAKEGRVTRNPALLMIRHIKGFMAHPLLENIARQNVSGWVNAQMQLRLAISALQRWALGRPPTTRAEREHLYKAKIILQEVAERIRRQPYGGTGISDNWSSEGK